MKKLITVFAIATLFMFSTVFTSCGGGAGKPSEDTYDVGNPGTIGTGQVVGMVLDNRGAPVEGATVTLGAKQVKTNSGGEFVIPDVSLNDNALIQRTASSLANKTAYVCTVTKDGYIPAQITGVYVGYEETQTKASTLYSTALAGLVADYNGLLNTYATALGTGAASTTTAIGTQTGDTVTTTTTATETNADEVFGKIAEALAWYKDQLEKGIAVDKQFYSTFASTTTMIPCDASFAGTIKLNLTTKGASEISATTYVPTSKPTVVATYKPNNASPNYRFEAQADENGYFKFDKCLPSGVNISFSIDSFSETIGEGENAVVYVFSSESSDLMIENSGATTVFSSSATTAPTAFAMDSINQQKSAVFMLYAQNDRIWIVDSNIPESAKGTLLPTTTSLVFKFNKAMKVVDITAAGLKDVTDKNITTVLSDGGKTATITPNDGNWTYGTTASGKITVTGEALDGAKTIINKEFEAFFDTMIFVGIDTTKGGNTFDDVDGLFALDAPITLTFSKPVEYADLAITGISNYYTKKWSDDKKSVEITPATYWDLSNGNTATFAIAKNGNTWLVRGVDGSEQISYWKTHSTANGIVVYFDNFVDVSLEDASTTTQEAFNIIFSKPLKAFDIENDLTIKAGATTLAKFEDYEAELENVKDEEGKEVSAVIKVTAKDSVFAEKGKYDITLKNLEAVDGSDQFRKLGDLTATANATFTTDFAYKGFTFRATSIEVLDKLPGLDKITASRSVTAVTNDQVLKITFTKPVYKSTITVGIDNNAAVKTVNYIDNEDARIVYVPLADVDKVNGKVVLKFAGNVTSIYGETIDAEPSAAELKEWFGYDVPDFYVYAALTMEGSSLIKGLNTASDKWNYTPENTVASGDEITFTFNDEADEVDWTLYVLDGAKAEFVAEGKAEASTTLENTYVIKTDKLVADAEKAALDNDGVRITTYYIDLSATKNGAVVFTTTNAFFPSDVDDTFEKEGIKQIYKSATSTGLKCGTIQIDVLPVALEGTNLVDLVKEEVVDVDEQSDVVFEFDTDLTGYKAEYELLDATGTSVATGEATVAGKKVTVKDNAMVIDGDNFDGDRKTKYEIVLKVIKPAKDKTEEDVVVFSTEEKFPSTEADSFENEIDSGKYKDLKGSNKGIKFNVKPILLEDTNLVDQTAEDAADKVLDVEQKTPITFTFDKEFAATDVVEYKIIRIDSSTGNKTTYEDTVTPVGKVVTIPGDKIIIEPSEADPADGKTKYEIVLNIKDGTDKDAKVIFSTERKFPLTTADADTFEDAIGTGDYTAIKGTNGGIAFFVKPYSIEAVDALLKEDTLFGEGQKSYTAKDPLLPGAEITIKFSSALPKDAIVEYEFYDEDGTTKLIDDPAKSEKTLKIAAATDTIKLTCPEEMAAKTDKDTEYRIYINIKTKNAKNEDEVLFSTANAYFGKASDYEADGLATNNFIDSTNKKLIAKVVQTKVLTVDETKDETVKTTTKDQFEESYKSPITLQLSHNVADYKAVIYSGTNTVDKIYVDAKDPAGSFTLSTTAPVTTYDEFIEKNAEWIYASTVAPVTANEITITPTEYFAGAAKVYIALFDADGNYTDVKFDDGSALSYTAKTVVNNDNLAEMLTGAAALAISTDATEIGNAQTIKFAFDTVYSEKSDKFATYNMYVKNAGDKNYSYDGDITTTGVDENDLTLTVTNYMFQRAKTTNFEYTIPKAAFQYGGNVEIAVVQSIDGVDKVYYAKLADKVAPVFASIYTDAFGYPSDTADDYKKELIGTGALEKSGTNDALELGSDLIITVTGNEWLKTVTAIYAGQTNDSAATPANKTSKATVDKIIYPSEYTAQITLKDVFLFQGDIITITAEDTSKNVSTYTITIK